MKIVWLGVASLQLRPQIPSHLPVPRTYPQGRPNLDQYEYTRVMAWVNRVKSSPNYFLSYILREINQEMGHKMSREMGGKNKPFFGVKPRGVASSA